MSEHDDSLWTVYWSKSFAMSQAGFWVRQAIAGTLGTFATLQLGTPLVGLAEYMR